MSSMFSKTEHKKPESKSVKVSVGGVELSVNKTENADEANSSVEIKASEHSEEVEELKTQITELETKIGELEKALQEAKNDTLRSIAETQTAQRRKHQELAEQRKYAPESLAKNLLPALLDLERIVHFSASTESAKVIEAVTMLQSKIARALETVGIEKIAPEPGMQFDPDLHEAVGSTPTLEHEEHTIAIVIEPGWKLHDHLLHAAKVLVAAMPVDE